MDPVPTGSYKLGTSQLSRNSSACVESDQFSIAWQCRDTGVLSYSIDGEDGSHNITLKSYELQTNFIYGAQGPIFHKRNYPLYLKQDVRHMSLGPALFFYAPFDKLVIISEDNFPYVSSSRRSVDASEVKHVSEDSSSNIGQVGDKPWFCWWNATYLEAFFYLNETNSSDLSADKRGAAPYEPSRTAPPLYRTSMGDDAEDSDHRRRWLLPIKAGRSSTPYYPRAVRFAERRLSQNGYPPYCQQMQVMDDGSITGPIGDSIDVEEGDTQSGPSVTGQYPDINALRRRSDDDEDRNSTCHCDWFLP